MKYLSLQHIGHLVQARPVLDNRRPAPMPGRKWPTRVAWHFQLADRRVAPDPITGKSTVTYHNYRKLEYVGRPNLYRALQVRRFIRPALDSHSSTIMLMGWQAEFDQGGLLAYKVQAQGGAIHKAVSQAFFAYHPHSTEPEITEGFCKPLFLKYIGGMRLYSQKRKLSQEAVEAYYNWYYEQFKRKLRRPKATPTAIVAGEVMENAEPQQ